MKDEHLNLSKVSIVRAVFCKTRFPVTTVIDKATSYERCVLRAGHDDDHQLLDGRRWDNAACVSCCAVSNEMYSPVQCDLPAGHEGEHKAFRGDGVGEANHWTWDDSLSIPSWIPPAYAQPQKKRSLLSTVRAFFTRKAF